MWYKLEEGKYIGTPRVKQYQVAWYDMTKDGSCFDEAFYDPAELDIVISYVETIEDINNNDRSRVFVHFDNGDIYELKLEKLEPGRRYFMTGNKFEA